MHACHPHGVLPAHWACRMFSEPWGIVVVRASWPRHPTIIKKKKKVLENPFASRSCVSGKGFSYFIYTLNSRNIKLNTNLCLWKNLAFLELHKLRRSLYSFHLYTCFPMNNLTKSMSGVVTKMVFSCRNGIIINFINFFTL